VAVVTATGDESIPEYLAGSVAGHHDHGPEGDVLEDHRESLVFAVAGHHLSLVTEVARVIGWRYRHEAILSQVEYAAQ
jgi:hypothetical protein